MADMKATLPLVQWARKEFRELIREREARVDDPTARRVALQRLSAALNHLPEPEREKVLQAVEAMS